MRPTYKGIYLSYYECEFYPVHTRDHKRCSSRFGIFESGLTGYNGMPEQGDPQEPQRFPGSKLWYLDGWYNQDEESKKKSWGKWIEEEDNIIWDPLDLNWLWHIHMEIWVWSTVGRSQRIWGIIDYMWELKPRMGFPGGSMVKKKKKKNPPDKQEMWVPSLGQEDPLEKKMEIHSSILAWRIL